MPVYESPVITYGTIEITRVELLSLKTSCKINQYLAERVNNVSRINPQSNDFDTVDITLKCNQTKYNQWLAYFTNAPTTIQYNLTISNLFSGTQFVLESMSASIEKMINDNTNQYYFLYSLDLSFVRAI